MVFHLNYTAFSQSESSNLFTCQQRNKAILKCVEEFDASAPKNLLMSEF